MAPSIIFQSAPKEYFTPENRPELVLWVKENLGKAKPNTLQSVIPNCFDQFLAIPNPVTHFSQDPLWEGHIGEAGINLLCTLESFSSKKEEIYLSMWWEGTNRFKDIDINNIAKLESTIGGYNYIFCSNSEQINNHFSVMASKSSSDYDEWYEAECPEAVWPISKDWFMAFPYNSSYSFVGASTKMVEAVKNVVPTAFPISPSDHLPIF